MLNADSWFVHRNIGLNFSEVRCQFVKFKVISLTKHIRRGQDSNLCGHSPFDFESNALTTRPPRLYNYIVRHAVYKQKPHTVKNVLNHIYDHMCLSYAVTYISTSYNSYRQLHTSHCRDKLYNT